MILTRFDTTEKRRREPLKAGAQDSTMFIEKFKDKFATDDRVTIVFLPRGAFRLLLSAVGALPIKQK